MQQVQKAERRECVW